METKERFSVVLTEYFVSFLSIFRLFLFHFLQFFTPFALLNNCISFFFSFFP